MNQSSTTYSNNKTSDSSSNSSNSAPTTTTIRTSSSSPYYPHKKSTRGRFCNHILICAPSQLPKRRQWSTSSSKRLLRRFDASTGLAGGTIPILPKKKEPKSSTGSSLPTAGSPSSSNTGSSAPLSVTGMSSSSHSTTPSIMIGRNCFFNRDSAARAGPGTFCPTSCPSKLDGLDLEKDPTSIFPRCSSGLRTRLRSG
ncbi:hypothetical protein K435DRAFT_855835 [Dendrothele bispora CBS 962.96]|uniref:Uncharacterized protein n=1 Tax=Dendrothele bispora (strain CBS 962.96) TaxID=1314807 RepID=A0A4S8MBE1_DENBC|nr:hypothetical protein K435DRAFT_855835 [Dendrothele bispora CBS 962.96]